MMNNTSKIPLTFEPLTDNNKEWLVNLFHTIYGKKYSVADVEKKFPLHGSSIKGCGLFACTEEKQVIGFFGATYFPYIQNGKKFRVANCTDSMVLVEFRRKRVMTALMEEINKMLIPQQVDCSFYTPNEENAYPTRIESGAPPRYQLKGFEIKTGGLPVKKIFNKIGIGKNNAAKILEPYLINYDPSFFKNENGFLVDENYYGYKNTSQHFLLDLDGIKVWIKLGGDLKVGWISNTDEYMLLKTVDRLKNVAKQSGANSVVLQFLRGSMEEQILAKHYASFDSWPIFTKVHNPEFDANAMNFHFCDTDSF